MAFANQSAGRGRDQRQGARVRHGSIVAARPLADGRSSHAKAVAFFAPWRCFTVPEQKQPADQERPLAPPRPRVANAVAVLSGLRSLSGQPLLQLSFEPGQESNCGCPRRARMNTKKSQHHAEAQRREELAVVRRSLAGPNRDQRQGARVRHGSIVAARPLADGRSSHAEAVAFFAPWRCFTKNSLRIRKDP